MSFPLVLKRITAALGVFLVIASGSYFYAISPHHTSAPGGIGRWLAWSNGHFGLGNLWVPAAMLYAKAERLFVAENRTDKALYAEVSQLPLMTSLEGFRPKFPKSNETALSRRRRMPKKDCVFSLFGECWRQIMKLGTRVTWEDVKTLALRQGHLELATGAEGEQGIAFAFLLGDTETAKKLVVRAWGLSKVERDPAATVWCAGDFGAGLVQLHRYKEALAPLDQAIKSAGSNSALAHPSIAVYAKIDALTGIKEYDPALALTNASLARLPGTAYE